MSNWQSFDDFLLEELKGEPQLAAELDDAFEDMRLAVQFAMCRESQGMSQQALALRTGIPQPMISRIEQGDQQPTWPTIRKLLRGLNASLHAGPGGEIILESMEMAVEQYKVDPLGS